MFDYEDDYKKATQHAQVNTYAETRSSNGKLIVFNLLLVSIVGYLGFSYIQNQTNFLDNSSLQKSAVLGVTKTVEDDDYTDEELIKLLKVTEVDSVKAQSNQESVENISSAMKLLVNESTIKSQTSYTAAIAQELEDDRDNGYRDYKVVIVKKGDTLSRLAEKYYGDSRKINKIINYNKNLSNTSMTLYEGETINIPY